MIILNSFRSIPPEQSLPSRDVLYHRRVHERNIEKVKKEYKINKKLIQEEALEKTLKAIEIQKNNNKIALALYRLLNVI